MNNLIDTNILTIVLYTLLYLFVYIKLVLSKEQMILYIYFIPHALLAPFSLYLINNGGFIREQNKFGYENEALYYYIILSTLMMFTFYFLAHKINISNLPKRNNKKIFIILSFFMLLLLIISNVLNDNINRFTIFNFENFFLTKIAVIFDYVYAASFLYFIITEKNKQNILFYTFIIFIILFFRKAEFTPYLLILLHLIVWFKITHQKLTRNYLNLFFIVFPLLVILFLAIKLYKLHVMSNYDGVDAFDAFLQRIIMDQHVLWGVVNLVNDHGLFSINENAFYSNFFTFNQPSGLNPELGSGRMMMMLNKDITMAYIHDGVAFSNSLFSTLLFYFDIISASLLVILLTTIFVFTWSLKIYLIKYANIVYYLIACKILLFYDQLIYTGDFIFINLKFFIYLFLLSIMIMGLKIAKKSRQIA